MAPKYKNLENMGYCYCHQQPDSECICQKENALDVIVPFFCFWVVVWGAFNFVPYMFAS
jgi:fucose 4-O-acetylase-like acetyltransferase